jgi:AraC-like DNA-binding protein
MGTGSLIVPNRPLRTRHGTHADGADDVLVARQPIVGMLQDDFERTLGELLRASSPVASSIDDLLPARWAATGVRHYLSEAEGDGYWDFYRPWGGLILSVTDAAYRSDTWVRVEGTAYFKVRILLSGTLHKRSGEILARAPQALLYVSPGASREGYFVASGEPTRMVVLHCRPSLLSRALGLDVGDVPPPLNSLFTPGRAAGWLRLAPTPEIIHVARRIIDSRRELSRALRERHLETLSIELLLQVLGMLESRTLVRRAAPAINARDLTRVYEARDYLAQHHANPPTIPDLARMVGLNQTKLKASFRETLGFTIYEYILERRMERASEMLLTGDYAIAQVAYAVGYDYPANFAAAFKRYFGRLPRNWKRNRLGH